MKDQPDSQAAALTFEYPALKDTSDEAQAAFNLHLQNYAADLTMRARRRGEHELLIRSEVDDAAKEMQPKSTRDKVKIAADWAKRCGFLFLGFAVSQVINIGHQKVIAAGSVWWLVGDAVVAASGLVTGFLLDRKSLR